MKLLNLPMKPTSLLFAILPILLIQIQTVFTQQYAGQPFKNNFPSVPGSEVTFWNIVDPNGNNASLLNYMITPNNQQQDSSQVQRAVIVIHGLNRDPETYMSNILTALNAASQANSAVNNGNVAIVAPYFANGDDKNTGFPWTLNATSGQNGSMSDALVWKSSRWANGAGNQYPVSRRGVSSYAVIDQMIKYFDNQTLYPNLRQIVVAGHSLGAQFVNRYASVGDSLGTTAAVSYWVGNPNSFLWFNSSRPIPTPSCTIYDDWRNGLSNYTNIYGATLANSNSNQVLTRWNSRQVTLARGLSDFGDDSSNCAPLTQGADRSERFYNQLLWFPPSSSFNIDYIVGVGHDAGEMFSSIAGYTRLFIDNFNDDSSRHLDFGPRQQIGDSPNPDPSNAAAPTINGTGADGMTYHGCWSDASSTRALSYTAYTGQSNATVETCTAACVAAGYTVAGMEYGNECYCDNGLPSSSQLVGDAVCSMDCAGNSLESCGKSFRLSIWSTSSITKYAAPSTPATIGSYSSIGCYTDSQVNRTLISISTSMTTMTLERCASFCSGYQYFGTEYGAECYCGKSITSPGALASVQSDCSMVCSGNRLEYCGAASRLSMYNLTAVAQTTTTSTITASLSTSISSTMSAISSTTTTLANSTTSKSFSSSSATSTKSTVTSTTSSSSTTTSAKPSTTSSSTTSSSRFITSTTSKTSTTTKPSLLTVTKTGRWSFQNCLVDSITKHVLSNSIPMSNITPEKCLAACLAKNYKYCGMSAGTCYGSKTPPTKTTAAPSTTAGMGPVARGCNIPCTGNLTVACGGTKRLDYYTYLGTKATNVSPSKTE